MHILKSRDLQIVTHIHRIEGHDAGANEYSLCKRAADTLNKHYPGHLWAVGINSEEKGGVLQIKNFRISYRYGMTLHLTNISPDMREVIRAGGELLERAHMKRGSADGRSAEILEGAPEKHQPFGGLII